MFPTAFKSFRCFNIPIQASEWLNSILQSYFEILRFKIRITELESHFTTNFPCNVHHSPVECDCIPQWSHLYWQFVQINLTVEMVIDSLWFRSPYELEHFSLKKGKKDYYRRLGKPEKVFGKAIPLKLINATAFPIKMQICDWNLDGIARTAVVWWI